MLLKKAGEILQHKFADKQKAKLWTPSRNTSQIIQEWNGNKTKKRKTLNIAGTRSKQRYPRQTEVKPR